MVSEYINLEDAKRAIMHYIAEQTVSKYASSAECKAARYGAEGAMNELDCLPSFGGADAAQHKHFWGVVYALADMVLQYGYRVKFRKREALCDGGLSALETAFSALYTVGCPMNSNGTISVGKLLDFVEHAHRMRGE